MANWEGTDNALSAAQAAIASVDPHLSDADRRLVRSKIYESFGFNDLAQDELDMSEWMRQKAQAAPPAPAIDYDKLADRVVSRLAEAILNGMSYKAGPS